MNMLSLRGSITARSTWDSRGVKRWDLMNGGGLATEGTANQANFILHNAGPVSPTLSPQCYRQSAEC